MADLQQDVNFEILMLQGFLKTKRFKDNLNIEVYQGKMTPAKVMDLNHDLEFLVRIISNLQTKSSLLLDELLGDDNPARDTIHNP